MPPGPWTRVCEPVKVDSNQVFHWERVGLAWSTGAGGNVEFRLCKNGRPIDDYGNLDHIIGGINPDDNYMLRKTIQGPATCEVQARHLGLVPDTFYVWALLDGWIVNEDLQGLMGD